MDKSQEQVPWWIPITGKSWAQWENLEMDGCSTLSEGSHLAKVYFYLPLFSIFYLTKFRKFIALIYDLIPSAPERFQAPEIPDNWEMYKDATKPAPSCITYSPLRKEVVGQEDCLNLNVFTPRLPMEGKDTVLLPVVVYLHPGLNQYGSSEEFDPKYWMDEDVIIVIPNWRQSFFGFLNTNDM